MCNMDEMLSACIVRTTCVKLNVSNLKRFVDAYAQFILQQKQRKKEQVKISDVLQRVQPTDKTI